MRGSVPYLLHSWHITSGLGDPERDERDQVDTPPLVVRAIMHAHPCGLLADEITEAPPARELCVQLRTDLNRTSHRPDVADVPTIRVIDSTATIVCELPHVVYSKYLCHAMSRL